MDKSHYDKTGSKASTIEYQEKIRHIHKRSFAARMGFAVKTPWDLIQLLLIPLILAGIGFWFTYWQNQTSLQIAQANRAQDLQIAATRYATDKQLADDQQQETTLQTYLENMSDLLLKENLAKSKPGDEVSQVAREQTLTTLRRLDAERNRIVLQFLQDAHLMQNTIIDLSRVDLSGANLSEANLSYATLDGANLEQADLDYANLSHATLSHATLSRASLIKANLYQANLSGTNLIGADLSRASLIEANLYQADLSGTDLIGADLRNANLRGAYLTNADLRRANLRGADLHGALLSIANLSGANLSEANLSGTDLVGADLRGTNLRAAKLDKTILEGARYNTREIVEKDSQGRIWGKIPPTQWPPGFDPKAAGAIEHNTYP